MTTALARLLGLLAILLMPVTMSAAPAAVPHHASMEAMSGHCGEHSSGSQDKARHSMECAAACSMMVAEVAAVDVPLARHRLAADWPPVRTWNGLHPEAETPPPRIS